MWPTTHFQPLRDLDIAVCFMAVKERLRVGTRLVRSSTRPPSASNLPYAIAAVSRISKPESRSQVDSRGVSTLENLALAALS